MERLRPVEIWSEYISPLDKRDSRTGLGFRTGAEYRRRVLWDSGREQTEREREGEREGEGEVGERVEE